MIYKMLILYSTPPQSLYLAASKKKKKTVKEYRVYVFVLVDGVWVLNIVQSEIHRFWVLNGKSSLKPFPVSWDMMPFLFPSLVYIFFCYISSIFLPLSIVHYKEIMYIGTIWFSFRDLFCYWYYTVFLCWAYAQTIRTYFFLFYWTELR